MGTTFTVVAQDKLIIQLREDCSLSRFLQELETEDGVYFQKMLYPDKKIILVKIDKSNQVAEDRIREMECVLYSTFDQEIQYRQEPNDYWFFKQWDMNIISAPESWNVSTGGLTADGDVIVTAVIDDGFYLDKIDLIPNLFINTADPYGDANEDGCPGICGVDDDGDGLIDEDGNGFVPGDPFYDEQYALDDDENGYIDDFRGLNLNTGLDDLDVRSHGTSVSAIIGAKGNNDEGVTGVNWDAKILPISGANFYSEVVEAYAYVLEFRKRYNRSNGEQGAFIASTNFSAGIDFANANDFPLWCAMYDSLGQAGVLSVGATSNKSVNVDEEGDMPSTCPSPYLITVTNSNDKDEKVGNAGYGTTHIDLAAPGNGSWTLDPSDDQDYGVFGGTSSATPHVTGAVSLLMSMPCEPFIKLMKEEPYRVLELKEIILQNVDQTDELIDYTKSGGRLNIYAATEALRTYCEGDTISAFGIKEIFPNPVNVILRIEYETEVYDMASLDIFNALGQRVYANTFLPPFFGAKLLEVNVSDFPFGIYFISLKQGKKKSAKKILIME